MKKETNDESVSNEGVFLMEDVVLAIIVEEWDLPDAVSVEAEESKN